MFLFSLSLSLKKKKKKKKKYFNPAATKLRFKFQLYHFLVYETSSFPFFKTQFLYLQIAKKIK